MLPIGPVISQAQQEQRTGSEPTRPCKLAGFFSQILFLEIHKEIIDPITPIKERSVRFCICNHHRKNPRKFDSLLQKGFQIPVTTGQSSQNHL